jgi:hypothetical protein
MLPRVTTVETIDSHTLVLTFDNQEVRKFDVAPYFHYPVYKPLTNPLLFTKAKVLNGTVVWDEIIDFAPETLYLESEPIKKRISTVQ